MRSIPIARIVSIEHYLDILFRKLEQDNKKLEELSSDDLKKYLEKTLDTYSKTYYQNVLQNPKFQLKLAKNEEEKVKRDWKEILN